MCLSDPRFHRKRIIWYIQENTSGSDYKAVGFGNSKGGGDFVGKVIPLQQPGVGSGMHADPVKVRVRLDRRSGVVSVKPVHGGGKAVNWIIRPDGFAPGSLRVPESCGPFIETFKNPKLLAPLTGADKKDSIVCLVRGKGADAFLSWGSFKHDSKDDPDPLAIDGGIEPKFFSVGFVGADRGVSIDICDPAGDDAVRCEMSRLVGNTRKTFIVGDGRRVSDRNEIHRKKNHFDSRKHKHSNAHKHFDDHEYSDSDDDRKHFKRRHNSHHKEHAQRPHAKAHATRSDALVKKIDIIERDVQSILAHATKKRAEEKHTVKHAKKNVKKHQKKQDLVESDQSDLEDAVDNSFHHLNDRHGMKHVKKHIKKQDLAESDLEDTVDNSHFNDRHGMKQHVRHRNRGICSSHPLPVRKHRVQHCPVQHPLLRPFAPVKEYSSIPRQEADLISRFRRLHRRLERLDGQVDRTESAIFRRFTTFTRWLADQKSKMTTRATEFADYLAKLKENAVYATPSSKKAENRFIAGIGKTLRKGKNMLRAGKNSAVKVLKTPENIIDPIKEDVINPIKEDVFDPIKEKAVDPIKEKAVDPVVQETDIVIDTKILSDAIKGTRKASNSTANSISNEFQSLNSLTAFDPLPSASSARSHHFDFNDDLIPPSKGPINPLGPVGPVLPPPAVKTFKNDQVDQNARDAAIEYLN